MTEMGGGFSQVSQQTLAEAVEANLAQQFAYFRRSPRAEVNETPELIHFHSGIPIPEYNGVVRARFASDVTAAALATRIQSELAWFGDRGQPFFWWVGEMDAPPDLADQLAAAGLTRLDDGPGMAADLQTLPEGEPAPAGVVIAPVADERTLRDWVEVASAGYGEPAEIVQARYAVHLDLGLGAELPLQRYVGYLDSQPVAMSALFLAEGVAGVYEVATAAHTRRRGIGAAITLAALRHARELGYRIAVLQSSPMGFGVYTRLGFRQVCTLTVFSSEPVG